MCFRYLIFSWGGKSTCQKERQVEIHLKMLIVKVPQEVHQRLLDAAHVKIILKECDPFHSDILTNHSYVVSFYRKCSFL